MFQKRKQQPKDSLFNLEPSLQSSYQYSIKRKKETIGFFNFNQLDGCCGVCILYNFYFISEFKGNGYSKVVLSKIVEMAISQNYSTMILTDVASNERMINALKSIDAVHIYSFTNNKTDNIVNITTVDLNNTGVINPTEEQVACKQLRRSRNSKVYLWDCYIMITGWKKRLIDYLLFK